MMFFFIFCLCNSRAYFIFFLFIIIIIVLRNLYVCKVNSLIFFFCIFLGQIVLWREISQIHKTKKNCTKCCHDIHLMISFGMFGQKSMGHLFRDFLCCQLSCHLSYQYTLSCRKTFKKNSTKNEMPSNFVNAHAVLCASPNNVSYLCVFMACGCLWGPLQNTTKFNLIQSVCKNGDKSFDSCTFGIINGAAFAPPTRITNVSISTVRYYNNILQCVM